MEVLVGEVEKRKYVLFGGHSVGITNGNVADNVNDVASEDWSVAEVKKKSGGGTGQPELTLLNEKLVGIIGESLLSGVGDTDAGPQEAEDPGM